MPKDFSCYSLVVQDLSGDVQVGTGYFLKFYPEWRTEFQDGLWWPLEELQSLAQPHAADRLSNLLSKRSGSMLPGPDRARLDS